MQNYILPIGAFLITALLMPLAIKAAIACGFTDKPGERKIHDAPVPPIGGLVIFPVIFALSIFAGQSPLTLWPLWAGVALLLLVGAWDDYKEINPWLKFVAQFAAAFLIVLVGDARLYHLGNLFGLGDLGLDLMSVPFSVIAVVLLVNAVNLMDGLDGLAGGYNLLAFLALLMCAGGMGEYMPHVGALSALCGGLGGFLLYNMRSPVRMKASVFLGDSGSMALGLSLAWFAMHFVRDPAPALEPISIAWILALPIMDTCAQFYRRTRAGRHPFSPDRGHFHHHFLDAGMTAGRAVSTILVLVSIMIGFGIFGITFGLPEVVLTVTWIFLLLLHMFLTQKNGFYTKMIAKLF